MAKSGMSPAAFSSRSSSPLGGTQRSHLWGTSSSIRPLVSRQRAHTPDLSIITLRSTTADSATKPVTGALQVHEASHSHSHSATLLHPSDFSDPDEVRDFSSVKPVKLRPSRGIVPLPKFRRLIAPLEPVHGIVGGSSTSKHLNSWPVSQRPLLSSSIALSRPALPDAGDGAHEPTSISLKNVRDFIDEELRLVRRGDSAGALSVYSEAFMMLIEEFQSFRPLLNEIRETYEGRIAELEETCQAFMMGDKTVQEEKEKYLELQSTTIAAFEKEKKAVDGLRVRAMDSEEAKARSEAAFEARLDVVREEVAQLKDQLLMEKTVRMEHEDNLQTALRLMHEATTKAEDATAKLEEVETTLVAENERLRRELSVWRRDHKTLKIQSDESLLAAEKKYQALLATCVDEEKLEAMKASRDKVNRTNVVLSKRNQWLQEQYDLKIKPLLTSTGAPLLVNAVPQDDSSAQAPTDGGQAA